MRVRTGRFTNRRENHWDSSAKILAKLGIGSDSATAAPAPTAAPAGTAPAATLPETVDAFLLRVLNARPMGGGQRRAASTIGCRPED